MILKEQLAMVSGKVKIGAVNGSGFFYAGKAEKAVKMFNDQGYGKLLDRRVAETYGSMIGEGTILLVEGKERGGYWSIEESDGTVLIAGIIGID